MKNKTYIFGVICVSIIVLGAIFKVQHWPLSGILLTLGLTVFILVFMPIALIKSYRAESDKKVKKLYILAYITVLVVSIGALFKIQHWPGAGLFLVISLPLPFVLFLPVYLLHIRKNKQLNYNNLLLVLLFCGYFAAISALLSLNVSKDVLKEFADSASDNDQETIFTNRQTMALFNNLQLRNAEDSAMVKSMQEIRKASLSISELIRGMELGIMEASEDNQSAIKDDGSIDYQKIDGKDNRSIYTIERFKNKSSELKKKLADYRKILLNYTNDKEVSDYINMQLSTPDNWYYNKFGDKIMIAIMDALSDIRKNVAIAELETVNSISSREL